MFVHILAFKQGHKCISVCNPFMYFTFKTLDFNTTFRLNGPLLIRCHKEHYPFCRPPIKVYYCREDLVKQKCDYKAFSTALFTPLVYFLGLIGRWKWSWFETNTTPDAYGTPSAMTEVSWQIIICLLAMENHSGSTFLDKTSTVQILIKYNGKAICEWLSQNVCKKAWSTHHML